jgi:hypothetical protein
MTQINLETVVQFHHDGFEFNDGSYPKHCFNLAERLSKYSNIDKLVYLERDPFDVLVSLYYQITGRFNDFFCYKGTISDFIRDDYFGASNLLRFRNIWAEIVAQYNFLKISYEDCHHDINYVMKKILVYYEFTIEPSLLCKAIENSTFDNMRIIEQSGISPYPWLRLRQGAPKVRSGKIRESRKILSNDDISYLAKIFSMT